MTFQNFSELTKRSFTSLILILCFGGAYIHSALLFSLLLGAIFLIIITTEWPQVIPCHPMQYLAISLIYPTLPIAGLIALTFLYRDTNFLLPLYPFFIAWTADTAGYIVGKLCGKHKIYPAISPGKSWEGLFGSFLGVTLLNILILPTIFPSLQPLASLGCIVCSTLYSAMITIVAFLGGFFISFLKRKQGLKDTGSLLPGHGGLLDRFDSVFFTVIIVWVVIILT